MEDQEERITKFEAVTTFSEANNHKNQHQLINKVIRSISLLSSPSDRDRIERLYETRSYRNNEVPKGGEEISCDPANLAFFCTGEFYDLSVLAK